MTYDDIIAELPTILMAQNRAMVDADQLQRIVREAEDEIIERLDHDVFRARLAPRTVSDTQDFIDLSDEPRRVLEVRAIQVVLPYGIYPLERREIERLNALYMGSAVGVPRYYAEDDTPLLLRVFPRPDTPYDLNVAANIEPERLSPAVQQSVLTRTYPRLLNMAVRKHGAHFMRNPADEQRYGALMDAALMEANTGLSRRRRDETALQPSKTANRTG